MAKRKKKGQTVRMKYPKSRYGAGPTPNDRLLVCDKCGKSKWTVHADHTNIVYHRCLNGAQRRFRDGTENEKKEAVEALEFDLRSL